MSDKKTDTAVILAAGWGSRIQSLGGEEETVSKPLIELGNIPLLTRVVQTLKKSGITNFVIVTGYLKERVEAVASKLSEKEGVTITPVFNPKWDTLANGVSLLAAKDVIQGSFVLTMSDHAYDYQIAEQLVNEGAQDKAVRLCIDRKIDEVFDIDDATKVVTKDDKIVEIDKALKNYNALDIGLFFCTTEVFTALQQAYDEQGDCSLSDGMRKLGENGRFGYMDIEKFWWQDVDTPETLVHAEKMLAEGQLRFPD